MPVKGVAVLSGHARRTHRLELAVGEEGDGGDVLWVDLGNYSRPIGRERYNPPWVGFPLRLYDMV